MIGHRSFLLNLHLSSHHGLELLSCTSCSSFRCLLQPCPFFAMGKHLPPNLHVLAVLASKTLTSSICLGILRLCLHVLWTCPSVALSFPLPSVFGMLRHILKPFLSTCIHLNFATHCHPACCCFCDSFRHSSYSFHGQHHSSCDSVWLSLTHAIVFLLFSLISRNMRFDFLGKPSLFSTRVLSSLFFHPLLALSSSKKRYFSLSSLHPLVHNFFLDFNKAKLSMLHPPPIVLYWPILNVFFCSICGLPC